MAHPTEPPRPTVCVESSWPSHSNEVILSPISLPNHTFTGQAKSSKQLISIVQILLPETDNCPSWISGRERMNVENISWSISTKEWCWPGGGHQSNAHPTKPMRPTFYMLRKGIQIFRVNTILCISWEIHFIFWHTSCLINLLIPSRMRIQLSHRACRFIVYFVFFSHMH